MPFYYELHRHSKTFTQKHAQRTAAGLLRLKEAFDAEGIEIPFAQQVVWHRGERSPERVAGEERES